MESFSVIQADYLRSRRVEDMRPVSLRLLARRLQLSPSTVSRALAHRSVRLPWGLEVPLIAFVPGQRHVLKDILALWLNTDNRQTDSVIAARLKKERGITVSRRTVNAVRHVIKN
jgi:DNA-directed RNA polymerase specialized sigma54-like protein